MAKGYHHEEVAVDEEDTAMEEIAAPKIVLNSFQWEMEQYQNKFKIMPTSGSMRPKGVFRVFQAYSGIDSPFGESFQVNARKEASTFGAGAILRWKRICR
uniref:Uncharacterized protein n=1 Tax=Cannabis sativa TaxID=3483 RepID=A0A803NTK0_CANSA